jgi:hypothetical protein
MKKRKLYRVIYYAKGRKIVRIITASGLRDVPLNAIVEVIDSKGNVTGVAHE